MAGIIRFRRTRLGAGGDSEWGGFRSMIWSGLLLGLLWTNIGWWTAPGPDPFDRPLPDAPDPWAESRRSGALLRAQEAAPEPAATAERSPASGAYDSTLRVVDGDTFWLGGDKIRIADIDTP